MRLHVLPATALLAAASLLIACAPALAQAEPGRPLSIRLSRPDDPRASFEVVGIDPENLAALEMRGLDPERGPVLFAVRVASSAQDQPTLFGSYRVEGDVLRFHPRFPLERGLRYRATLTPSLLPVPKTSTPIVSEFTLARLPVSATTRVVQVFPTRGTIPENQLKLYIQFSAPMSRGGIYRHIHLIDLESGRPVKFPFLEIDEELWDPTGTRLTLLFDPGRIKTGLKPREILGQILHAGRSYILVIDTAWPDAEGNPLAEPFRKTYRVGPGDVTPPDPSTWKVHPPASGTRDPIRVTFPEPLDRALLARTLGVRDAMGHPISGDVSVESEETAWTLTPDKLWATGEYRLVIDKDLEDLAGNQIGRAFEVDVFETIESKPVAKSAELQFRIEARFPVILPLALSSSGDTRSFPAVGRVTRILITDHNSGMMNKPLKIIKNERDIKEIVSFIDERRTGWRTPWGGVPIPSVTANLYDGEKFKGHFGVGSSFFETQRHGDYFASRSATQQEIQKFLNLIGAPRKLIEK